MNSTTRKLKKNLLSSAILILGLALLIFVLKTYIDLRPIPDSLSPSSSEIEKLRILDRNNIPLTVTYQNRWNVHDIVPLYEIPEFIQKAFIVSEDKRFYSHHGVDWRARLHALWQNGKSLSGVRGASTITEQVVRMWHPRVRSIWSRWLEGIEAARMEKVFSKAQILDFYLNQVPYTGQRRGIAQAAKFYFDREIDTLNRKEILALAVMVRAPSRLDIHKKQSNIDRSVIRLAGLIKKHGLIDNHEEAEILKEAIQIKESEFSIDAQSFIDFLYRARTSLLSPGIGQINTTIDASLQTMVKTILENRVKDLSRSGIDNGAVIILDNQSHEILAWINSGRRSEETPGSWIDAASTPRQPGSTLKPFAYALALEKGWTAATLIDDSPLAEAVGTGLHSYHNYSHVHYGLLTLRNALGNSLNIPAVRTLQFIGVENFLTSLHQLGMNSLQQTSDFYGDGMVLGNGEITLYELVQAYGTLANRGIYHPFKMLLNEETKPDAIHKVFSPEAASLIGNILSDPGARRLEFGYGGLLNFPVQTAVKTGTSSDYRDAWAIGYNNRYTIGVWMGNLDRDPMDGITGSKGPAMVLRSVFAELNRNQETQPLYLSPRLVKAEVRMDSGDGGKDAGMSYSEWFMPGTPPKSAVATYLKDRTIALVQPSSGLQLAMDPRIPDDKEAFSFKLSWLPKGASVEWYVDNDLKATTSCDSYLWPVTKGAHVAMARVRQTDTGKIHETLSVDFIVK
jgi:penicillin-binding protein 1C